MVSTRFPPTRILSPVSYLRLITSRTSRLSSDQKTRKKLSQSLSQSRSKILPLYPLSKRSSQVAKRRSKSSQQMLKVREIYKHGKISLEMPRIRLRLHGVTSKLRKEVEAIGEGVAETKTSSHVDL